MLSINGKSLDMFNSKLINREITTNEVITVDDWLDGAIQPTFIRQQEKFKDISLNIVIEGSDEQEAMTTLSQLAAELKYCELRFDDIDFTYKAFLNGKIAPKRLRVGYYELPIKLKSSYGYTKEQVVSRAAGAPLSFSLDNKGTAETPVIIEITPTSSILSLTLEGFTDKPATIKNLVSGQKVVINGETNSILVNGNNNFSNYDAWGFPSLIPGTNNLKVSTNAGYSMVIKYKPRYI